MKKGKIVIKTLRIYNKSSNLYYYYFLNRKIILILLYVLNIQISE